MRTCALAICSSDRSSVGSFAKELSRSSHLCLFRHYNFSTSPISTLRFSSHQHLQLSCRYRHRINIPRRKLTRPSDSSCACDSHLALFESIQATVWKAQIPNHFLGVPDSFCLSSPVIQSAKSSSTISPHIQLPVYSISLRLSLGMMSAKPKSDASSIR